MARSKRPHKCPTATPAALRGPAALAGTRATAALASSRSETSRDGAAAAANDAVAYAELKKETRASQPTTVVTGRSTADPTRQRSTRARPCLACGNPVADHDSKTCPYAHTELDLRPRCACCDIDCDAVITNYNARAKNRAPVVARLCPTRC